MAESIVPVAITELTYRIELCLNGPPKMFTYIHISMKLNVRPKISVKSVETGLSSIVKLLICTI